MTPAVTDDYDWFSSDSSNKENFSRRLHTRDCPWPEDTNSVSPQSVGLLKKYLKFIIVCFDIGRDRFSEFKITSNPNKVETKPSTALHWAARDRCKQAAQGLATLEAWGVTETPGGLACSTCRRWLLPPRACVSESQLEEVSSYKNPQTQARGGTDKPSNHLRILPGGSPVSSSRGPPCLQSS